MELRQGCKAVQPIYPSLQSQLEESSSAADEDASEEETEQDITPQKKQHAPPEEHDFSKLPIDAFPPAPKVSTERPDKLPSQVTKQLAAVKTQNPKRFNLSARHGTPRYDDRGYWNVPTSAWPVSIQK
ncbi:hypothetical protein ACEQ8H_000695 [Pleosporales sp. CAS-2024a]